MSCHLLIFDILGWGGPPHMSCHLLIFDILGWGGPPYVLSPFNF